MEKIEDQAPKEHKKNWREVYSSVDEIKDFLANRIFLRHNVITRRVEYRLASSFTQDFMPYWQPIEDRVVNSLWTKMCRIKPTRVQDIFRVIESDYVPDFNPFTDYLEHLPPWDGCNNILVLSASVRVKGGVKKQELFYKYLRKWLVAMVAAWVDPNEVNHEILVFYTKTNANRMGRDDLLTLAQYGLVCCEELDTMRPSELNQLKAAVTMQSIDERAAYARYHEHRNHIASFCGTGNNIQFLNDLTGNRRWLPFEVDFIENPRTNPIDYEAVFSEAYALYQKEDFHHWLNYNEMEQLSVHNETFEATQQELELIRQTFRLPGPGEKGEFITRIAASVAMWCAVTMRWRNASVSGPWQKSPRTKTTLKVTTMTLVTLFSYNPSRTHVIFIFLRGTREKLRNSCHMCHHCHQQ